MPTYECTFLGENNEPLRTEVLGVNDELEARREAMKLMMRLGRFSGYELWAEGRVVSAYKTIKESG